MGFNGDLMGFNGDLMGFNGDDVRNLNNILYTIVLGHRNLVWDGFSHMILHVVVEIKGFGNSGDQLVPN